MNLWTKPIPTLLRQTAWWTMPIQIKPRKMTSNHPQPHHLPMRSASTACTSNLHHSPPSQKTPSARAGGASPHFFPSFKGPGELPAAPARVGPRAGGAGHGLRLQPLLRAGRLREAATWAAGCGRRDGCGGNPPGTGSQNETRKIIMFWVKPCFSTDQGKPVWYRFRFFEPRPPPNLASVALEDQSGCAKTGSNCRTHRLCLRNRRTLRILVSSFFSSQLAEKSDQPGNFLFALWGRGNGLELDGVGCLLKYGDLGKSL